MAMLSFALAVFSLLGYMVFVYGNAASGLIFFTSLALGIISVVFGFIARGKPWAKAGMTLGIIDTAAGMAMMLWLTASLGA